MQIITGKTGVNHVKAEDDRAFHAAVFGLGNYVLDIGSKFAFTLETSNNISIADGELLINGTHARIRYSKTDTVIIENGNTGYNRIDLIVARYKKTSGLESVELAVIKGESTTGTPIQPTYIEGNVLEGVELTEMPLYAVKLDGVNVASVTPLFTIMTGLPDVYRKNETYTQAEVDAIKQTLQTATNKAQSSANAAQSTADTAKTNADKAQSTADTAKANAATAQSTANSGKIIAENTKDAVAIQTGRIDCIIDDLDRAGGTLKLFVDRAKEYNDLENYKGAITNLCDGLYDLVDFLKGDDPLSTMK